MVGKKTSGLTLPDASFDSASAMVLNVVYSQSRSACAIQSLSTCFHM